MAFRQRIMQSALIIRNVICSHHAHCLLVATIFMVFAMPVSGIFGRERPKKVPSAAAAIQKQKATLDGPPCELGSSRKQRKRKETPFGNDYARDVREYTKLVIQGNCSAMNSLGLLYFDGRGVALDYAAAATLFRRLPNTFSDAKNRLAWLYETGNGVNRDPAEALRLYGLAATAENSVAQYNMGLIAQYGKFGVRRNYVHAAEWFRLSADRGNADARNKLAEVKAMLTSDQAAEVAEFERKEDVAKLRARAAAEASGSDSLQAPPRVGIFDAINQALQQQQAANQARINTEIQRRQQAVQQQNGTQPVGNSSRPCRNREEKCGAGPNEAACLAQLRSIPLCPGQ